MLKKYRGSFLMCLCIMMSVVAFATVEPRLAKYTLTGIILYDDHNADLIINPMSRSSLEIHFINRDMLDGFFQKKASAVLVDVGLEIVEIVDNHHVKAKMIKIRKSDEEKAPIYDSDLKRLSK